MIHRLIVIKRQSTGLWGIGWWSSATPGTGTCVFHALEDGYETEGAAVEAWREIVA